MTETNKNPKSVNSHTDIECLSSIYCPMFEKEWFPKFFVSKY